MNGLPVLQLMSEVLREHYRTQAGEFQVIAVLVPDLDAISGVVEAVARQEGGVLLAADAGAEGVPGSPDDVLEARIQGGISILGPNTEPLSPELVEEDDHVRIRFRELAEVAEDPGHRELLGALTLLFHEELRRRELVILSYREGGMQADAKRELWNFLTGQLRYVNFGGLRTLVALVASDFDVDLHCSGEVSCRFAIVGDRLVRRQMRQVNRVDVNRVVTKDVPWSVLFLGAGFSVSSQLPLGNGLRDEALERLLPDVGVGADLPFAFYQYVSQRGRLLEGEEGQPLSQLARGLTLERVLAEELVIDMDITLSPTLASFRAQHERARSTVGIAVQKLQEIVRIRGDRKLILATVNFDELLEEGLEDELHVIASDSDFDEASDIVNNYLTSDGPVPYLKFHGTIRDPASIRASIDQTSRGLSVSKLGVIDVMRSAKRPTWTYVGYSMRDIDLVAEWQTPRHAHFTEEFWVLPLGDEVVQKFVADSRRAVWQEDEKQEALEHRTIYETADDFFSIFLEFWRS